MDLLFFFLDFFILSLFLVKERQALYVNPGCLKSPANKKLFIIEFILYFYKIAISTGKSLINGIFIRVTYLIIL